MDLHSQSEFAPQIKRPGGGTFTIAGRKGSGAAALQQGNGDDAQQRTAKMMPAHEISSEL
jgi:hypothetical protein